ncbi:MAG: signal recognition particle-docking protein FtsY [Nanoarchaeota archaeon]
MFKFLKEKLKTAISKISEGVEKEGQIEEKIIEIPTEEAEKKEDGKGFFAKLKQKFTGKEDDKAIEEKRTETEKGFGAEEAIKSDTITKKEEKPQIIVQKKTEQPKILEAPTKKIAEGTITAEKDLNKKGFFESIKEKIVTTKINDGQFNKLFWDLELALMENNVAVEVIEKLKINLKIELVEKPIKRTKIEETVQEALKTSIQGLFDVANVDLIVEIRKKAEKPYVIVFFGINGSGKTTSIAKLANMLNEKKISCVLAASDTFRAASIEQLQQHADKLKLKMIRHNYSSDPAAVAFDAIKHAKAKNIDVVLIDTAGRMHSNVNLIDEMKKIIRVAKPDLKVFVGESITGNDCVEQAKTFNEAVGIDGIILAKADVDEKGGAAVSVSYVTKKPILFLGTGQKYSDLQVFDSEIVVKGLGLV